MATHARSTTVGDQLLGRADPPAACPPGAPQRRDDEPFWTVFECSSDGMVLVDPHHTGCTSPIIDCNAAFCRMNGYSREELLGQSIHILNLHHGTPDGASIYLAKLREAGKLFFEDYHRRKNGSIFPVAITTSLLSLDGRELILGIDRDISGRIECSNRPEGDETGHVNIASLLSAEMDAHQLANQALRESEGRFHLLFEHSPDGIVLIDPHHPSGSWPIIDCNTAFCVMNGYTRDECIGNFIDMLNVGPSEPGPYLDRLRTAGIVQIEAQHRRKDGTVFPVEVATALVQVNGRELVLGIDRDISERKRVEVELVRTREAALEASRMKSEFLAMMSHEIRTPMNGMIGMVDLLLTTELDDEQHDYATTVAESAQALLTILNDILDFSKIEAGKLDLEVGTIDLRALFRNCSDLVLPRARQKGITLEVATADDIDSLLTGDAARLRQVLLNLLSNALKFTEHGKVSLRSRVIERDAQTVVVRCEVVDTGPGIPAAVQTRLFQPFSQADGSTTRKYGGTGLGLVICKRLVELMGGQIGFQSTAGSGSRFWFEVPLQRADEQPRQLAACQEEPLPAPAARILVAEDNVVNQKILLLQLRKLGYTPDLVETGRAAVTAAAGSLYQLILMDIHMPEMDGLTATELIRAHEAAHACSRVPIVALTASALQSDHDACLAAGMDDYLSKPFKLDQLRPILTRWIAPSEHGLTD